MKLKSVNKNSCCRRCIYFVPDPDGLGVRCAAYNDIPGKYLKGWALHNRVDEGQIGEFVYTPKEEHGVR